MQVVIGTRGSKLAMVQAEYVRDRLQEKYPEDVFLLKTIKTKGDRVQDRSLSQIGGKGVFVREIEKQLLEGEIQLAVHSMKDMPAEMPEGLCFAKSWSREDARDVLVLREAASLEDLPHNAVIGTGSKRRALQLLQLREDLRIVDIRGNVDTRLARMEREKLDGIVLAAAGLNRLGRAEVITQYLEPEQMIPAPAQGVLAIQLRAGRKDLLEKVNAFADEEADRITRAERTFVQEMGGDCTLPVGAYASVLMDGSVQLLAAFGSEDGSKLVRVRSVGKTASEAAKTAASGIREALVASTVGTVV